MIRDKHEAKSEVSLFILKASQDYARYANSQMNKNGFFTS